MKKDTWYWSCRATQQRLRPADAATVNGAVPATLAKGE
jgi:hypothetical protein